MARKPRPGKDNAAPGQPAEGSTVSVKANTCQPPEFSQTSEEAVRRLARLMGRQVAREQAEVRTKAGSQHAKPAVTRKISRKG